MAQRDSEGPSRDEVQQRIHSLYDRAETATGNFNATRAMSTGTRRRTDPLLGRQRRGSDPALEDVTREWFSAARAKLGPTVPAALPADRVPDGVAGDRSVIPVRRPGSELPGLAGADLDRTVRELTAGAASGADRMARELPAGPAAGPVAELTAGPMAALPAVPASRQETPRALPGAPAEAGRPTPTTAKERSRRKLAAAREMLDRHAARQGSAGGITAVLPGVPSAADLAVTAAPSAAAPVSVMPAPDASTGLAASEPAATAPGTAPFDLPAPPVTESVPATPTALMSAPPATALDPNTPTAFATPTALTATAPLVAPAPPVTNAFVGVPETGYGTKAAKALAFARAQIGKPCVWGATGPDSFDAAGLTQAAWKAAGVVLPRSAPDQAATGTPVSPTGLQPGDLVFFQEGAVHVGICTGNGMMIHAPGPGAYIREESIHYAGPSAIQGAVRPA